MKILLSGLVFLSFNAIAWLLLVAVCLDALDNGCDPLKTTLVTAAVGIGASFAATVVGTMFCRDFIL